MIYAILFEVLIRIPSPFADWLLGPEEEYIFEGSTDPPR